MPSMFPNLPKPDNKNHIEVKDALNQDIIKVLNKQLPLAVKEAAPLAQHFKGRTPLDTAKNIWLYERTYKIYQKDTEEHQDIRMPRRFHDEKKAGDCKSFALNALAIYKAIYPTLPVAFKYTAYHNGADQPSHVYAVVKDYAGNNIIIDGCYNFFNSEKDYTFTLPLKFDMNVRVLSDRLDVPNNFHEMYDGLSPDLRKQVKNLMAAKIQLDELKAAHSAGRASKEQVMAGIEKVEQCIGAAKKIRKHTAGQNALHWLDIATLALGRGAYDALVALNLNGMADKLLIVKNKYPAQWKKISNLYYQLGGYEKALVKAANIGSKHRPIFLSPKAKKRYEAKFGVDARALNLKMPKGFAGLEGVLSGFDGETIGVLPVVAAVASAAPVLGAISAGLAKAFHSAGDTTNASEALAQTQDHIAMSQPGQPLDPNNPDNQVLPPAPPPPAASITPLPASASEGTPDPNTGVDPSVFSNAIGEGVGDVWGDIGGAIGGLFHLGMKKLKDKLNNAAKVNPTFKQLGNIAIDGASYITGKSLATLGGAANQYTQKLDPHPYPELTRGGALAGYGSITPTQVLLGVGFGLAVGKVLKVF